MFDVIFSKHRNAVNDSFSPLCGPCYEDRCLACTQLSFYHEECSHKRLHNLKVPGTRLSPSKSSRQLKSSPFIKHWDKGIERYIWTSLKMPVGMWFIYASHHLPQAQSPPNMGHKPHYHLDLLVHKQTQCRLCPRFMNYRIPTVVFPKLSAKDQGAQTSLDEHLWPQQIHFYY